MIYNMITSVNANFIILLKKVVTANPTLNNDTISNLSYRVTIELAVVHSVSSFI